jgi:hypothetical protein
MSQVDLLQVQIGKESTWGTAVNTTAKLRGIKTVSLDAGTEIEPIRTRRGSLIRATTAMVKRVSGKATVEHNPLDYEDLPYWLDMLFSQATPSGTGPYTRNYAAPDTSAPAGNTASRSSTLVYGDADGAYHLAGATGQKIVIKGDSNGPWSANIDLIGKEVQNGVLQALDERTVTPIMGADTTVAIDAWAGTMGNTAVNTSLLSFELTVDTKRTLKWYMGSGISPAGYRQPAWEGKLKLVLEFNATTKPYLESILDVTATAPVQFQVRISATVGTNTALKLAQIDFAGTVVNQPKIFTETDGVSTVEIELEEAKHPTFANWLKIQSKNGVSELP